MTTDPNRMRGLTALPDQFGLAASGAPALAQRCAAALLEPGLERLADIGVSPGSRRNHPGRSRRAGFAPGPRVARNVFEPETKQRGLVRW